MIFLLPIYHEQNMHTCTSTQRHALSAFILVCVAVGCSGGGLYLIVLKVSIVSADGFTDFTPA